MNRSRGEYEWDAQLDTGEVRVLHVDDNEGVASVVAEQLERADDRLAVVTETSVGAAIDRLESANVDCVVSDYDMPGVDGLEFLETVREAHPDLPFILFTGKGNEDIASEAISAGVTDYLQKAAGPEQYAVLANRIENAVEGHRTRERLRDRVRQQEAIARLARTALESPELDAFLERAAEEVTSALETDATGVFERRPEGENLLLRAGIGLPDDRVGSHVEPADPAFQAGYTLHSDEVVVVEDVEAEDRFDHSSMLPEENVVTSMGVSIGGSDDPWGVLGTHSTTPREFDQWDRTFVRSVANLLATAIDRAEHERRLSTLISNLHGMVYRCDNEPGWPMSFVAGQVEELTGYTADQLESGEVVWGEAVLPDEERDWLWETVQEAVDAREPFEVTYPIETADGERRWMWEQGRGVYSSDGTLLALEGFITDVTEQRQYERRLERERDRLEEFAEILSHDLRSPLEAANGHVELIAAEGPDEERVQGLREQLDRMEEIIQDVLAVARHDDEVTDPDVVDVAAVARSAWETGDAADGTLKVDDVGAIEADRSRLQQLLENLFRNALEHGSTSPRSGTGDADVSVTVGPIGDRGFYVADDGPGIPEEERDAVFESGYSSDGDGTGLGLAIVEEFAHAHGWSVGIAEAEGGGARIEVTGVTTI